MMKNYLWFFLGLLCPLGSLFSQTTIISQTPIPIISITDQVALQTSLNDPSIYVFQEIPNRIQGVTINLPEPQPQQPYEIHLQEGNARIQFASLFSTDTIGSVWVSFDGSPYSPVSKPGPTSIVTDWVIPPTSFLVGSHTLDVKFTTLGINLNTIKERAFTVVVSPASDGYFQDAVVSTPVANRNSLTRYSNPDCSDARPILIVEGFDPPNNLYPEFYRSRGAYMAERFFELKYDVFVLDFQLNAQSMTNNAAVVEAAVAFLSDLYDDELVALVGVSMGGIISRLAATRAEDAGTPLPISMLVTMDSPHRGAVVDKAFQDYILDEDPTAAVRGFGNQAALELLVYNTNDQTGNTIHDNFYASLRALNNNYGYPLEVPTVGVAFSPFTTGSNPHIGKIWLDVNISTLYGGTSLGPEFKVESGVSQLGSFLPTRTSNIPSQPLKLLGFPQLWANFDRNLHPTFIQNRSALDLVNGQPSMRYHVASDEVNFHDEIPPEVVDLFRARLFEFSPSSIPSGKFYNFSRQVGSVIRRDMDVFGTLRINESGYSGFSDDPDPASSFTSYSIRTQNCKPITVDVQSGGIFHLGEGGGRTSTVRIQEGSSVILESGSTLKIDDNSTLIIEPGATFRVENGASIQLLGNNAVLQIEGDLILGPGATFGFTGAGFVRLGLPDQPGGPYPNVILDGNGPHGIAFIGSGPTDKVLEIMSHTYLGPDYDLDVFSIQGGRVELGEDASINTAYADLTLQNVHFTALDTDQPFKTIFGNGQINHTIDQVEIDHADIGINWRGIQGDNASLTMTDSDIHDCGTAIKTRGRSAILDELTLTANGIGWDTEFHSGVGSLSNSDVSSLGFGIFQDGSGHIHVQSSDLQNGTAGVFNQGTGSSSVTCSDISSVNVGIGQTLGGWIALDNQRNNKISASWRSLSLDDSWFPLLYQGKNGLLGTGSSQAVFGTIFYPALVLAANNNQWNSNIPNPIPAGPNPGTSPTSPADYVLSSPQGAVTISDPGPTAWQACGSGNSGISADWVAACSECPTIATSSYNNVRLDLAINDAMNLLYDSNHEYQAPVAAAYRFHEILTAGYSYTASVTSLLDLVAFRFREAVEAGIAMDSIDTTPAIHSPNLSGLPGLLSDALGIWIAECVNQDRDLPAFYLSADRALIWDWVGQPAEASADLQDLRSEATGGNLTWLDNWTCYLDIRDDILNHQITPEVADSLLDLCVALPAPNLSGNNNARFGLGVPSRASGTKTEDPFRAYPNPAEGRLLVEGSLSSDRSISICLLSMAGQAIELMPDTEVAAGDQVWKLSLDGIPAGMYILEVSSDRQQWREKIVVR